MLLLTIFAGVALVLAALGIYAVMAHSVAERRGELAIRMALGADGSRVLRLVMGQAVLTTAVGLTLGLLGAIVVTRLMTGLLFDVRPPILSPLSPRWGCSGSSRSSPAGCLDARRRRSSRCRQCGPTKPASR